MQRVINGRTSSKQDTLLSRQKRIMLWAMPRSLSSVMCRVMMNSGKKTQILFEPYSEAYYFGPDRVSSRYNGIVAASPEQSFINMKKKLEMPYQEAELVFAKDMSYALAPDRLAAKWIPEGYTHTLICRHPRSTVLSLWKVSEQLPGWEQFDPSECGYREQVDILRLLQQLGHRVTVLDADDLMDNPEGMLRAYCRQVGLEFCESMLNWQPLSDLDFSQIFCRVFEPQWFLDMKNSSRLTRRPRHERRDVSQYDAETVDLLNRTVEENIKYYEVLQTIRLEPEL